MSIISNNGGSYGQENMNMNWDWGGYMGAGFEGLYGKKHHISHKT